MQTQKRHESRKYGRPKMFQPSTSVEWLPSAVRRSGSNNISQHTRLEYYELPNKPNILRIPTDRNTKRQRGIPVRKLD